MKKNFIPFFVYSSIIIVFLASFLVLHNANNVSNESNKGNNQVNNTEIYASSLILNCARSITIDVNSTVKLLDGYISIEPSSLLSKIETKITNSKGMSTDNLTFENNIIHASVVGKYNITFSVLKNKTTYLYDRIVVNVVDANTDNPIKQIKNELICGEEYDLLSIFEISPIITSYNVYTHEGVTHKNNKIIATKVSKSVITFKYNTNFVEHIYSFSLNIIEQPKYVINCYDKLGNLYNNANATVVVNINSTLHLNYKITDLNGSEYIYQNIIFVPTSYIDIEITSPIIKLKFLKVGEVSVEFSCIENKYIKLTLNFIIK